MSNVPEETGKVITSVVDTLKNQPLMILVIVLNLIFIWVFYSGVTQNREFQAKEFSLVLDRCTGAKP